jgi:hypothetical protein
MSSGHRAASQCTSAGGTGTGGTSAGGTGTQGTGARTWKRRRSGRLAHAVAGAGLAVLAVGFGTTLTFAAPAGAAVTGSAAATPASCTKATLAAAKPSGGTDIKQFGCAGDWAYAFVIVHPHGSPALEQTSVYHSSEAKWHAVNRTVPCEKHEVPQKIYKNACETN